MAIGSILTKILVNTKTFSSFKNRSYRFYFGGILGHMACMNMQQIPNGLLIERMTNSPAIMGILSLAGAVPMVILSLFGGVIADRVEKKYLVAIGQGGFAVTSLATAIALSTGYLSVEHAGSWWILAVSSVIQGCIIGVAMPARQALLSEVIQSGDLMNAISLNFLGTSILQLIAPIAAGFLVNVLNYDSVYYIMTFLYLVSLVMFALVPRTGKKVMAKSNPLTDIKDGLTYVWRTKVIFIVLISSFLVVTLSSPYSMLMPFFADDILEVGANGMGILLSMVGLGSILASIVLATLPNRKRGMLMLVSGIFLGISLIGFAVSRSWTFSLILMGLTGVSSTVAMTLCNTLIQYNSDDSHRGRVMSLFIIQFGISSFANFGSGLFAQEYGVQWAVALFAVPLVILPIAALLAVKQLRKID
jgi:MFS family permease